MGDYVTTGAKKTGETNNHKSQSLQYSCLGSEMTKYTAYMINDFEIAQLIIKITLLDWLLHTWATS